MQATTSGLATTEATPTPETTAISALQRMNSGNSGQSKYYLYQGQSFATQLYLSIRIFEIRMLLVGWGESTSIGDLNKGHYREEWIGVKYATKLFLKLQIIP